MLLSERGFVQIDPSARRSYVLHLVRPSSVVQLCTGRPVYVSGVHTPEKTGQGPAQAAGTFRTTALAGHEVDRLAA